MLPKSIRFRKALAREGIDVADLDLVELNEAFASQAVAWIESSGSIQPWPT